MSMYDPIWIKLKSLPKIQAKTIGISINAPPNLHKRIVKAVTKRKWLDLEFKLQIEPKHAIMWHKRKGVILTFYLKYSTSLDLEDF